jgi:predicted DNA-binding protein (UPF0251 family)
MPRPKRIRKVNNPPHFKGFRPIGLSDEHPILLNYEEYEAIRLSDFEFLSQVEASGLMGVSRSTFTRIYESARRKVAQAFVLGRPILFEGGKVYFDSDWYLCKSCGCWFNHPAKDQIVTNCALCGSIDVEQYHEGNEQNSDVDLCICPQCGLEKMHTPGIPCQQEICSSCNVHMIRKGSPHRQRRGNINCK